MHHYLQDNRSLDMHCMLAKRLRQKPELLSSLKAQFAHWDSLPRGARMKAEYRQAWLTAIATGVEAVCALATEESDRGQALRSCSPFGTLWTSPAERLAFMRTWIKKHANMPIPCGRWKNT